MHLIARFRDRQQVSSFADTLRNEGFDRKEMIISDPAERRQYRTAEEAAAEIAFVRTEREGLGGIGTFADGVKGCGAAGALSLPSRRPSRKATGSGR